jgi:hypothetical protein
VAGGGQLSRIVSFNDGSLVGAFGLPAQLPAR